MKNLKYYAFIFMTLSSLTLFAEDDADSQKTTRGSSRVDHARELMGKSYSRSVVSRFEDRRHIERKIFGILKKRLPEKYRDQARYIGNAIIVEASRYSLDPFFILAVISGESSFNPEIVGTVGEIGLMQIRPSTAKWICDIFNMTYESKDILNNPIKNIKIGVAYLSWLRNYFDGHGQLYLAAYNMGPGSVQKAISRKVYPKTYPIHVMKRYIAFYKSIDRI